tara:strand:- start:1321 stop:1866 length:546 start_codon:yes stop_codon:yes gene_type:complete
MIKDLTFLHFLTASVIIEAFILYLFRFTKSPLTGIAINRWYDNLGWSAVILDILSFLIGFYIAKFIYEYLVVQKFINTDYEIYKFLGIVLCVQIIHDFSFYFFVIKPYPKNKNRVMDEFKSYAERVKSGAVIGDSIMYLLATPLLYLFVQKNNINTNTFISIVCFYLIGYLIYQKPKISMR